jgi:iron complex outermembrane receptor protein
VASGSLRFTPTENLTFDLSGFYSRDRTDGRGFQCFSTGGSAFGNVVFGAACDRTNANGIRHTRSNVRQFGATDMFATSSTLAWDMGQVGFIDELTFKAIGAYQNIDGSGRTQDYDGTDLDGAYAIEIEKKMAQASGELQILGEAFDKRLNFVMGAYIDREWTPGGADTRFTSVFPTLEPGRLLSTLGILSLKNKSRALYSQFTYDFNEVVSLTAGIRYTKDTKGFRAQKFSVSSLDPAHTRVGPFLTNGVFIKDFTNTSPMATLQLNAPAAWTGGFLDKGMIYFTFSKGFKSGGFNGNGEVVRGTFTSFNPEKVDNYETGIKFSMFDRHLTGSLTGYKMDYRDIQLQVTGINPDTGGFINTTFNAGAAEVKGIELEMQALLTSSLRFGLNADVSDSRYTRFDDASVPGGSRVGEPLAFIPDYRISGSLENRFSLGEDMALTPRVQVTRTGDRYLYTDKSAIVRAASLQRAVTLVDASLRFDLNENVSFDVYGKNIFNKKYKDDVQSVGFVVMSYYAPPVTYGVNARLKF